MRRHLFAGLAVTAGLLAGVGITGAPALAQAENVRADSAAVTEQAEAWSYVGRFTYLSQCRAEGQEWVRRTWAYQYKCVGGPEYSYYNLWVIPM
ncbi:MAG TPA: hypothetical protein VFV66_15485 [Nonomuraea sp.]|nr:hypothetical protein [Nonomuraea sp.]